MWSQIYVAIFLSFRVAAFQPFHQLTDYQIPADIVTAKYLRGLPLPVGEAKTGISHVES
jgi:hypothetical protein